MLALDFVMVHVRNIAEVTAFYVDYLDLVVEDQNPGFVQFRQPNGRGAIFALTADAEALPIQGVELWWVVDDVDGLYERLKRREVRVISPPTDQPFGRALSVQDTAGNLVNFFQPPYHS